jgi:hypothetical protein
VSEREEAVQRVAQHYGIDNPSELPLLPFLEACQPGFRSKLDRVLADRGLMLDGTNTIVPKEKP